MQVAGSIFTATISLGLMVFLGRTLGPLAFGDFVAWLGLATLALILIEGGWPTLVYRESVAIAGHEEGRGDHLAGHGLRHLALCGTALAGLAWLAHCPTLAAALGCMTLVAAMNLVSARLRGAGRFAAEAGWQMAGRMVSAAAIVAALLVWPATPTLVFEAWAAGLALVLATNVRRLPSPFVGDARTGYEWALPFVLVEGLSTLVFKSDVALLKLLAPSPTALSDYAACTRFNEAALLLAAPFANVLLRTARQRAADVGDYFRLAWSAAGLATLAGAAMWTGAAICGDVLVRSLFGPGFDAALLRWTSLALVFALPNLILLQVLVAGDRERSVVVALGITGLLLPFAIGAGAAHGGAYGAAAGLAVTHAMLFAGLCLVLVRRWRVS